MSKLETLFQQNGFPARTKLYSLAKEAGLKVSYKTIDSFLEGQVTNQLHKRKPKNISTPITTGNPKEQYQMDLLDMTKFSHENKGFKWILICIDVFSRVAFGVAMKDKTAETTLRALKEVLQHMGQPKMIVSDSGSEFKGSLQKYLDEKKIIHRVTEPMDHHILGLIDRFSQTIKVMLYKYFTHNETTKWIEILPKYVDAYNHQVHSTTGLTPLQAEKYPTVTRKIHFDRIQDRQPVKRFAIGDVVKVKLNKGAFSKGYTINWSTKNHVITDIEGLHYELDNGKLYRADSLQKVKGMVDKDVEKKDVVNEAHKKHRVKRILQSERIEPANTTRTTRSRAPVNFAVETTSPFVINKILADELDANTGERWLKVKYAGYPKPEWESYDKAKRINGFKESLKEFQEF